MLVFFFGLPLAHAQQWNHTPQEYYATLVNPSLSQAERSFAYTQLREYAEPRPLARYLLAQAYINGATGEGGPVYARNSQMLPPNRPTAYVLAIPLLEQSAGSGYAPALRQVAELYLQGVFVTKNVDKALLYLQRLAESGDGPALEEIERIYSSDLAGAISKEHLRAITTFLSAQDYDPAQIARARELVAEHSRDSLSKAEEVITPLANRGNTVATDLLEKIRIEEDVVSVQLRNERQQAQVRSAAVKTQHDSAVAEDNRRRARSDRVLAVAAALMIGSMLISIPGIILGCKDKLVVYYGSSDLAMACIIVVVSLAAAITLCSVVWWGIMLLLLDTLLIGLSIRKTFVANQSAFRTLLAFPTKLSLPIALLVSALVTLGGVSHAVRAFTDGKKKEGFQSAVRAVLGFIAFIAVRRLIIRLVRDEPISS